MSNIRPVSNKDELGIFAWIKVPEHVATPEASEFLFTVDFRVSYRLGIVGDDVTPARPVGKAMPARPGVLPSAKAATGAMPDDGAIETACLHRGGSWTLSIIPVEASCNGMPFDAEWGPLSFAQGWINGDDHCSGGSEEAGYGLQWRRHATTRVLLSLISEMACHPAHHGEHPTGHLVGAESGVFAWLGWPKSAIVTPLDNATTNAATDAIFAADFRAVFREWHPGKLRGTVCPPEPVASDISKSLQGDDRFVRLASVDLAKGRWTLYAKGPATVPAGLTYQVVAGPRSQACHWLATGDGKHWRDGVDKIILVTLTSHAMPL